jgi:hypothetical protein
MTTTTVTQTPVRPTMQVPSSDGKRMYTITLPANGNPAWCSCPAWRFQKLPPELRVCKHLRAVAGRFVV